MEITQTTDKVTLVQILPGDPPKVLLREWTEDVQGNKRPFKQIVLVRDPLLLERLKSEVSAGDEIEATVVTEWRATSSETFLANFRPVSQSVSHSLPEQRVA